MCAGGTWILDWHSPAVPCRHSSEQPAWQVTATPLFLGPADLSPGDPRKLSSQSLWWTRVSRKVKPNLEITSKKQD